jgi:hypothetical protein
LHAAAQWRMDLQLVLQIFHPYCIEGKKRLKKEKEFHLNSLHGLRI